MIQYIYFVKCPNCEDEPFDFFDDAKGYALGCLSKKPIITQTEVDRNDFGECTSSADLGTIWSWEDEANVSADDPAISVFSKGDFAEYNPDQDAEFSSLDNSLDSIPDNFCKPVPPDMTIKAIVEAMEENEDTVECVCCQELYPKEDCKHDEKHGWICPDCVDEVVECTWCEELYDRSQCRYEVDMGWLCDHCEAAIKSRGETLTFRENSYWDLLDEDTKLKESTGNETVDLEYDDLTITICGPKRDVDDWDEVEHSGSYTLTLDKDEVATAIWENFITEEDVTDVPGGLEALEDDDAWAKFLETHFDILFEKYYDALLKHYEDEATEAYEENYGWYEYQSDLEGERADFEYESRRDDFYESASKNSMLEELEDADAYNKRLQACPECGKTSFDTDTAICINCGLDLN